MKQIALFIFLSLFSISLLADNKKLQVVATKLTEVLEDHVGETFGNEPISIRFGLLLETKAYTHSLYSEGSIIINRSYLDCDLGFLELNLSIRPLPYSRGCDLNEFRRELTHELGHLFLDRYARRNHPGSWLLPYISGVDTEPSDSMYGTYIISEGIGEYFASLVSQPITEVSDSVWFNEYDLGELRSFSTLSYFSLTGGGHVVSEIIKSRGFKNGIDYLLTSKLPLVIPDMSSVYTYMEEARAINKSSFVPQTEINYSSVRNDYSSESFADKQKRLESPFNILDYPTFIELTDKNFAQVVSEDFVIILICNGSPFEHKDFCQQLLDSVARFHTNHLCYNRLTVGVLNGHKYPDLVPRPAKAIEDEETGESIQYLDHNPFQVYRDGFATGESFDLRPQQTAGGQALIVCGPPPIKLPVF